PPECPASPEGPLYFPRQSLRPRAGSRGGAPGAGEGGAGPEPTVAVMAGDGDGAGGFARQVRDALVHLYDPVHLQTHPLARGLGTTADGAPRVQAGRGLPPRG